MHKRPFLKTPHHPYLLRLLNMQRKTNRTEISNLEKVQDKTRGIYAIPGWVRWKLTSCVMGVGRVKKRRKKKNEGTEGPLRYAPRPWPVNSIVYQLWSVYNTVGTRYASYHEQRKSRPEFLATVCQSQTAAQSPASIRRHTSSRSSVTRSVLRSPV